MADEVGNGFQCLVFIDDFPADVGIGEIAVRRSGKDASEVGLYFPAARSGRQAEKGKRLTGGMVPALYLKPRKKLVAFDYPFDMAFMAILSGKSLHGFKGRQDDLIHMARKPCFALKLGLNLKRWFYVGS
ncbi:MAG: hypothetical protein PW790_10065 [Parvibaculaceae bacterium]|nr:hypothetical protein [Parvibaculaceae bacterium]